MTPLIHIFSPSVFFIALGKLRQERGNSRRIVETMRSNLSIGFS